MTKNVSGKFFRVQTSGNATTRARTFSVASGSKGYEVVTISRNSYMKAKDAAAKALRSSKRQVKETG